MSHKLNRHYDTPKRAKIQGVAEFYRIRGTPINNHEIFQAFGVKASQGYKTLKGDTRTRHNQQHANEIRGRKNKITGAQVREAEAILQEEALKIEGKRYTWAQLATEFGADVHGDTMRATMRAALNYHKCLACVKGWLDEHMAKRRVAYAHNMLQRYPLEQDWHRVRFSDEVHFGYGPEGQIWIIRQPGTRYRQRLYTTPRSTIRKGSKTITCLGSNWA